jgi:hypothetical protein
VLAKPTLRTRLPVFADRKPPLKCLVYILASVIFSKGPTGHCKYLRANTSKAKHSFAFEGADLLHFEQVKKALSVAEQHFYSNC